MAYIEGYVLSVRKENLDKYKAMAMEYGKIAVEHGALRSCENWGEDVPHGQNTDFYRAVQAEEGEVVIFSFVEWESKAIREVGNQKIHNDPRLANFDNSVFNGKKMIFGGFENLIDTKK